MLEKEFVPYQDSLELKELEFNEPCFGYYIELRNPSEGILSIDKCENNADGGVLAPTYSQAFRWFREKYNQDSLVAPNGDSTGKTIGYYYEIIFDFSKANIESDNYKTYEEAELACLKKLIEIVKTNK